MKSWAFAFLAASIISSSVAFLLPYRMFSSMVVPKSMGSWPTIPMLFRSQVKSSSVMSFPSSETQPESQNNCLYYFS